MRSTRITHALLALALLAGAGAAAARDVAVGVFAWQGEPAATADWSPVLDYLNGALPEHRFRLDHYDAAGLRDAVAARRLDLVITNPGHYVAMEAEFGLSRIATRTGSGMASPARAIGSAILVRGDRADLQDIPSLAGKKLAAVAADAFGGYLVAARELQRRGVDPEDDLRQLRFVGLPMNGVVDAVRRGEVDAGVVRTCLLEQLVAQERIGPGELRVLSPRVEPGFPCATSTELYPDWPIAVTRETDAALAKAVARALLAMPESGPVSWSVPADYRPVHDLYLQLKVGPYEHLRHYTPQSLARRFWPWLAGIAVLLLAWGVHTVRVEYQVHRRTAQLRASLQAQQAAEAGARESQERMEHLSRLSVLGELSGSLAHEINQPLTTIATYARTLVRRQAARNLTPEALADACTEIAAEAERAGGILQRIRSFARKRPAVREPVDLPALAEEARRLISGMLAQSPPIVVHPPVQPCGDLRADGAQILQVLVNLVKNAIDAGRALPPERQPVHVHIESAEHRAVVHVVDRGSGLDEAQRQRLFEPFFTTKPDGLGLGLPICKTIVEAHGGRLWAEANADGPGMRFSFSLPCHERRT